MAKVSYHARVFGLVSLTAENLVSDDVSYPNSKVLFRVKLVRTEKTNENDDYYSAVDQNISLVTDGERAWYTCYAGRDPNRNGDGDVRLLVKLSTQYDLGPEEIGVIRNAIAEFTNQLSWALTSSESNVS